MDLLNEISIEGFKVVSGDYFSSLPKPYAPLLTIGDGKLWFTKRDVLALNSCEYVLVRVNAEGRKILIVPTKSTDKDAIRWVSRMDPIDARRVSCPRLTDQLFEIWGWDKKMIYRSMGKLVTSNNKVMLFFDFSEPEIRQNREVK